MDLYGHIATTIHDLPVGVINEVTSGSIPGYIS